MEAKDYQNHWGGDVSINYGKSITDADLIMSDGKCVEHTRVTPDEMSLLTPADLVSGRDPVLAHAAEMGEGQAESGGRGENVFVGMASGIEALRDFSGIRPAKYLV
jgi:hypothetical protein